MAFTDDFDLLRLYLIHALQETYELAGSDGTNLLGLRTSFLGDTQNDYSRNQQAALESILNTFSGLMNPESVRALFAPFLRGIGDTIGSSYADGDYGVIMEDLYDYMVENNIHLVSRGITYGSASAGGSNVGDGTITRYYTDKNSYPLESVFMEAKSFTCTTDQQNGGQRGRETFLFEGSDTGQFPFLSLTGSAARLNIRSMNAIDTGRILRNPSFEDGHGATSDDTALTSSTLPTGWTWSGTASELSVWSSVTYRKPPNKKTTDSDWSLEINANGTLSQVLRDQLNPSFDRRVPYHCQVAVYTPTAVSAGTVTLHLGGVTAQLDLSTATNDAWTILSIGGPTSSDNWYDNFKEDALDVKLVVASLATSGDGPRFDDMILEPCVPLDGTYYALVGGATAFLRDDVFTLTDALGGSEAVNQYWFFRAGLGSLPAVSDATEVTASGGRTLTFVASSDTCTASSGSWITDGYKVGMNVTFAGTSNNNVTLTLTAVSATVLTFASGITDEGPLSATATVNATAITADP